MLAVGERASLESSALAVERSWPPSATQAERAAGRLEWAPMRLLKENSLEWFVVVTFYSIFLLVAEIVGSNGLANVAI